MTAPVKVDQAEDGNVRGPASRLVVSRTRIMPWPVAASTQSLPLAPL